jgi:hypothetical protein
MGFWLRELQKHVLTSAGHQGGRTRGWDVPAAYLSTIVDLLASGAI